MRKTKSRTSLPATKVRFTDVDLDENQPESQSGDDSRLEEDSEEMEGDSDEFLDVLDVLDGRGEPDFGDETEGRNDKGKGSQSEAREEDGEGEDDEDEDEVEGVESDEEARDPFAPSDSEEQSDEEALDKLEALVSKLEPGKKRKAEDEVGEVAVSDGIVPARKRRMFKERTEAGVESEFGVHAASGVSWLFYLI